MFATFIADAFGADIAFEGGEGRAIDTACHELYSKLYVISIW